MEMHLNNNKSFAEFTNESNVSTWIDYSNSKHKFSGMGEPDFVGNFHPKSWANGKNGVLYSYQKGEKPIKNEKMKPGEFVFRYESETTKVGNMMPVIKINLITGKVFFFNDNTESFEKRSIKTDWLNILKEYQSLI
jgi:hypothetical protein